MVEQQINDVINLYQQLYFTHDTPIPFKGDLKIYPVLVEDYYKFYSCVDVLKINKNEDVSGLGIAMTNLQYLIHLSLEQSDEGKQITQKIITLFELIFHVKNGIFCEKCNDQFEDYDALFDRFKKKLDKEEELNVNQSMQLLYETRKCPVCGADREDFIRYKDVSNDKKYIVVGNTEIDDDDFDLLRKVVCYQNIPDYDDEYIDPELKKELELKAKMENPDNVQPSLEKQETCLIASTAYTYETIQKLSIRHLVMLLRTVDTKLHYFAYRQAEASGFVKFNKDLDHWIYSNNNKKSVIDGLQTLDGLKEKLQNVAKM